MNLGFDLDDPKYDQATPMITRFNHRDQNCRDWKAHQDKEENNRGKE